MNAVIELERFKLQGKNALKLVLKPILKFKMPALAQANRSRADAAKPEDR